MIDEANTAAPSQGGSSPSPLFDPLTDQRFVEAMDWLHTALCELESAVRTLSPDPNGKELLCCRNALGRAQVKIREVTDMSAVCQANVQDQATEGAATRSDEDAFLKVADLALWKARQTNQTHPREAIE